MVWCLQCVKDPEEPSPVWFSAKRFLVAHLVQRHNHAAHDHGCWECPVDGCSSVVAARNSCDHVAHAHREMVIPFRSLVQGQAGGPVFECSQVSERCHQLDAGVLSE